MPGIDVDKLSPLDKAEQGAWMLVYHPVTGDLLTYETPEGETKPCRMKYLGADSKKIRKMQHKYNNALVKAAAMGRASDEVEDRNLELAIAACVDMEGFGSEGRLWPYNETYVKSLHEKLPWLVDQAIAFINKVEPFLD